MKKSDYWVGIDFGSGEDELLLVGIGYTRPVVRESYCWAGESEVRAGLVQSDSVCPDLPFGTGVIQCTTTLQIAANSQKR